MAFEDSSEKHVKNEFNGWKKKKVWGTDGHRYRKCRGHVPHVLCIHYSHALKCFTAGVRCFLSLWLLVRGNSCRSFMSPELNCECRRRNVTSAPLGRRPYTHSKVQSCFSLFGESKTSAHWRQTELADCYATVVLSAHSRTQSQVTVQRLYGPAQTDYTVEYGFGDEDRHCLSAIDEWITSESDLIG